MEQITLRCADNAHIQCFKNTVFHIMMRNR